MLSMFLCKCSKEDSFQIIREYDAITGELQNIYFRCFECGKDYSLEEVKIKL
ncbi:hypothetical protein D3C73_1579420 [compost metagenome]